MNSRKWAFPEAPCNRVLLMLEDTSLLWGLGLPSAITKNRIKPLQDSGLQKKWYVIATSQIWGGYFCSYLMNYWHYYRSMVLSSIHTRIRRIISSLTMIRHTPLPAELNEQLQAAFQAWCFFAYPWILNLVTCTHSLLQIMMLAHRTSVNYINQNRSYQL